MDSVKSWKKARIAETWSIIMYQRIQDLDTLLFIPEQRQITTALLAMNGLSENQVSKSVAWKIN